MHPHLFYELMKPYLEQRVGGLWADYNHPTYPRRSTDRRHDRPARPKPRS